MTIRPLSGGTWQAAPSSVFVRYNNAWVRVGRLHVMDGGVWKSDANMAPGAPTIAVTAGQATTYSTTNLTLTPATTGGYAVSWVIAQFKYDAAGSAGSKTWVSEQTIPASTTTASFSVLNDTRYSFEVYARGINSVQSPNINTVKWKTGHPQVMGNVPNGLTYGPTSDWINPYANGYSASTDVGGVPTAAIDSDGGSVWADDNLFPMDARNDQLPPWGGTSEWYERPTNWTYVPHLFFASNYKRKIVDVLMTYACYTGPMAFGIRSRGAASYNIEGGNRQNVVGLAAYDGVPAKWSSGLVLWENLNIEKNPGESAFISSLIAPCFGTAADGAPVCRHNIAGISLKIQDYNVTTYAYQETVQQVANAVW